MKTTDLPNEGRWAVEIKRSLEAKPAKGFHVASEHIEPARGFLVYAGEDRYRTLSDFLPS